jgi:phosphoenolpyruvate carboxylase
MRAPYAQADFRVGVKRDDILFPERHSPLREDIHSLGEVLGAVLRDQGGAQLFDMVEQDRQLSIKRRSLGAAADEQLAMRVRGRPPAQASDLVRAFASWFQLVNLAEKVHRVRRRREYFQKEDAGPQPGGVADALGELKAQGLSLPEVLKLLAQLSIEPVLMAHPMESTRRTLLRRQQRMADLLMERSNAQLAPVERRSLLQRVRSEITADWQTAEHPRERLTVADEREHALYFLAEVIYGIVPAFYHELTISLAQLYGVTAATLELPVIVRFGSWVGGDMDGLPDVHAKSIRDTLARQQRVIINNYFEECQGLSEILSQSAGRAGVSSAVMRRIEEYRVMMPGSQGQTLARHDLMPYRVLLGQVTERLRRTYDGKAKAYERPEQFRGDINLIASSLSEHSGLHAGYVPVRRLLWRIDTFGFHLASLDVRQRTNVHHAVLAQGLDDPTWTTRSARDRYRRMLDILERDAGPSGVFDALGKRTLAVFDAMIQGRHRYGEDAVGLYIVSGAASADDVLAPLVLARWAEAYDRKSGEVALDIAPQFDSVGTLENCGDTMRQLLGEHVYRRHLESRGRLQTVLVGYSESNLESGIVASRLAAYRAQRTLTRALRGAREGHVLFYSRGGSIARGGGAVDGMLRASPAESVSGVLRFTEQGESINQSFGLRPNAMRTLERAFGTLAQATLAVRRGVALQEGTALAECAAIVASASRRSWQDLVYADPKFYDYFYAVTPIDVIERMQIGNAEVRRRDRKGVAAIQPVAWVYAWSQSRHMLPGWYGAGTGLSTAKTQVGIAVLRRCYQGWPFFRLLINDIETMLGRADLPIAAYYDRLADPAVRGFATQIQVEYELTRALLLEVKECAELLDTDHTLQRAIALRNPYVDPMNLMQVDLLQRWRATGREDRALFEALLATVGGIGRGLQTTG